MPICANHRKKKVVDEGSGIRLGSQMGSTLFESQLAVQGREERGKRIASLTNQQPWGVARGGKYVCMLQEEIF